jgi:hypothetical protein
MGYVKVRKKISFLVLFVNTNKHNEPNSSRSKNTFEKIDRIKYTNDSLLEEATRVPQLINNEMLPKDSEPSKKKTKNEKK